MPDLRCPPGRGGGGSPRGVGSLPLILVSSRKGSPVPLPLRMPCCGDEHLTCGEPPHGRAAFPYSMTVSPIRRCAAGASIMRTMGRQQPAASQSVGNARPPGRPIASAASATHQSLVVGRRRRTARVGGHYKRHDGQGPSEPSRARRTLTRRALVQPALRLFAERGRRRIQEITDAADVGQGTFYNHFTSKADLFDAAVEAVLERHGCVPGLPFSRRMRTLRRYCDKHAAERATAHPRLRITE